MQPVKEGQEKTDAAVSKLAAELETLRSRVTSKQEETILLDAVGRREERECLIQTNKKQASSKTYANTLITEGGSCPKGLEKNAKEEDEIRNLFRKANSTITIGPNTEEEWRVLVSMLQREENMEDKQAKIEAYRRMIEEYLELEMSMKETHITEVMSQVVDIVPMKKVGWKSLVVKFNSPDIVEWILRGKGKMRQGVEGESRPVVQNWVPDGMYRRYNAVRSNAFKIRHEEKLQTRIIFGDKDFQLVTRRSKDDFWGEPVLLTNLPGFQTSSSLKILDRGVRSPTLAPGRARYGGAGVRKEKRPLSSSPGHSPNNKQSKISPECSDDDRVDSDKSEEEVRPARTTRAKKSVK